MTLIQIDRHSVRFAKPVARFATGLMTVHADGTCERELIDYGIMISPSRFGFSYLPTPVTCLACEATFPHTELQSNEFIDSDGGSHFCSDVCPKCGEVDCADFEYESLPDSELERIARQNSADSRDPPHES